MTLEQMLAHPRFRTLQRDDNQYTAYARVPGQNYDARFGGGRSPEDALAMALALLPGETEAGKPPPSPEVKPIPVDDDEL